MPEYWQLPNILHIVRTMTTVYPAQIDSSTTLPTAIDNITPVSANVVNQLRDAILAVEGELGVKPSSTFNTVRARLDDISSNMLFIGGDLGGSPSAPIVIGLRGRPVSSIAPTTGYILGWNGSAWQPIPNTGGSGSFSPGGDLGGTGFSQVVIGIRTIPVSATLPTIENQVLRFDGSNYVPDLLTEDMILPGFSITSFGTGQIVEVGQTITTPNFTASYSTTPDITANSVVLTDDQGNAPKDVSGTPTSFSSNFSYTKNAFNDVVVWTDTAKKSGITRTSTTTAYWWQNNYYGKGPAGQTSQAFIQALVGSFLSNVKDTTFSQTTSVGEYIYYCYRSAYGTATFTVGGFSGGFTLIATTSVTNAHGFVEDYYVYQSSNDNLGATTVVVS